MGESVRFYNESAARYTEVSTSNPLPVTGGGTAGGATAARQDTGNTYLSTLAGRGTNGNANYTKGATSTQSGTLTALNSVALDTFDALDYQSVTIQVTGTFVGIIQFEVSNDGVSWVAKSLTAAVGAPNTQANSANVLFGDIGARYIRARMLSYTSGSVAVTAIYDALSTAPPSQSTQNVNVASGTVAATLSNGNANAILTSVNLAASALYTGTTVDSGTSFTVTGPTRIRPTVMHLAGLIPGILRLDESNDGTTWRETRRSSIPSDGQYHTLDWPLHMRYYRLVFLNGTTAQTAFYLAYLAVRGEGSTIDTSSVLTFPETPAAGVALAASAALTGSTLDLGTNHNVTTVRLMASTDAVGAIPRIDHSMDGVNWFSDPTSSVATTAGQANITESKVVARYVRARIINGATAQTAVRMTTTLVTA